MFEYKLIANPDRIDHYWLRRFDSVTGETKDIADGSAQFCQDVYNQIADKDFEPPAPESCRYCQDTGFVTLIHSRVPCLDCPVHPDSPTHKPVKSAGVGTPVTATPDGTMQVTGVSGIVTGVLIGDVESLNYFNMF